MGTYIPEMGAMKVEYGPDELPCPRCGGPHSPLDVEKLSAPDDRKLYQDKPRPRPVWRVRPCGCLVDAETAGVVLVSKEHLVREYSWAETRVLPTP